MWLFANVKMLAAAVPKSPKRLPEIALSVSDTIELALDSERTPFPLGAIPEWFCKLQWSTMTREGFAPGEKEWTPLPPLAIMVLSRRVAERPPLVASDLNPSPPLFT